MRIVLPSLKITTVRHGLKPLKSSLERTRGSEYNECYKKTDTASFHTLYKCARVLYEYIVDISDEDRFLLRTIHAFKVSNHFSSYIYIAALSRDFVREKGCFCIAVSLYTSPEFLISEFQRWKNKEVKEYIKLCFKDYSTDPKDFSIILASIKRLNERHFKVFLK